MQVLQVTRAVSERAMGLYDNYIVSAANCFNNKWGRSNTNWYRIAVNQTNVPIPTGSVLHIGCVKTHILLQDNLQNIKQCHHNNYLPVATSSMVLKGFVTTDFFVHSCSIT